MARTLSQSATQNQVSPHLLVSKGAVNKKFVKRRKYDSVQGGYYRIELTGFEMEQLTSGKVTRVEMLYKMGNY